VMSTPFNNQWVLGRPRWRRRGRAAMSGALPPPSDPPAQEGRPHETGASRDNRRGRTRIPGFDPAFTGGAAGKPPRWIDRDI
jgi:hypothetical protein